MTAASPSFLLAAVFNRAKLTGMSPVTQLLQAAERGERFAAGELLPLVYDELRKLAAERMTRETPGQTLQPTALVHEAFVRLVGSEASADWDNRGHFFAAAAEAMRRILVENARRKHRLKRGGNRQRLEMLDPQAPSTDDDLLALDEALTALALESPDSAKVVELRHFAGLGHEDIAQTLGISVYLARQRWNYAKAWLHDRLTHT